MSDADATNRPRYSAVPLPPYSYVPGFTPHPVSDPRGHLHGQTHAAPQTLAPEAWRESTPYLYGVDLFNHGFYWEAHEAWESLWHAAGREGPIAVWLKGLIKLAAAGVKAREGNATGVKRHAHRALELCRQSWAACPAAAQSFAGLTFQQVEDLAVALLDDAEVEFQVPNPSLLLRHCLELDQPS